MANRQFEGNSWTPPKGTARLRVTLERPPSKGGSETAYVMLPKTYEEAVDLVHEVFNLGARSVKKEDITLCCLSSRDFGYDQQFMWASIIPREWGAVVRPHIDEVGVFLAQDRNEWGGVVSLGRRMLGPAKSLLGLLAIGYALRRN